MIDLSTLHIDSPRFRPGSRQAYLVAAAAVAIATLLRLALSPWAVGVPYVTFFPAIILVTFLAGSAAGALAALLSGLSAWLFIIVPVASPLPIYQTALFGIGAVTVVCVVGAMRIATAHVRRASEALRVSEERFRGLLEAAPDAVVIVDEQRRIALVNAAAEELFGYRRVELLGLPVETLVADQSRDAYLAELTALLSDPPAAAQSRKIDVRGVRRDGREFPADISLGPLRTDAGILIANAVRDITARKQIEAGLAAASKAKSDFLASVSHELRTPLNAIIGFSEMIRDAVIGPLDARYREYGGDINASGRHLQNIINDILDISKIEGGGLALQDEIVSVADTVEACRRIVAAMAEAAGVSLSVVLPGALPLFRLDQIRFRQILLNLMSNGVKFTPAGGSVTVSAAMEADGAVIAVSDTGIGMRAEDIAVALEPFRQIEGPLSRRFDGTGLGLPLAKALVQLHGGRLEIESAPAAGTTVRIWLPLERVAEAAA